MKQYIGTKVLNAKPMTRGEYNAFRGWAIPDSEDQNDEGYLVEYADGGKPNVEGYAGYVSWSPKDVFENSYRAIDAGLSFPDALRCVMRGGHCIARAGWNGKGMFVALADASKHKFVDKRSGEEVPMADFLVMKTAQNVIVPWLASQSDMLAFDWYLVD